MSAPSYIIVGSGVFGASAALALIRQNPTGSITIIDRGCRPLQSASWDWTKVIRADYPDPLYAKLALEAKNAWRHDPLYKEYYHETGLIWVDDNAFSKAVVENYSTIGAQEDWEMVSVSKLREINNGLFADADFGTYDEVYVNWSSGWAEAGKALERVIETAISEGVIFTESEVDVLTFDEAGNCTGVKSTTGEIFKSDRVVLTAGAETGALLVKSAPGDARLHAGDRLTASGLITGRVRLSPGEAALHEAAPTFLHARGAVPGGLMPSNRDRDLKIGCDITFSNLKEVLPGYSLSTPPQQPESVHAMLADRLKFRLATLSQRVLGKRAEALDIKDCRICWDAITPTQDFIISAHPHAPGLWIATGGSLHGWKFLPTLGKYIVQKLQGKLAPELCERWDWDRNSGVSSNKRWFPSYDISDL